MSIKEIPEAYEATPHEELMQRLLDSRIPKTELEHAAARELCRLREALEKISEGLMSSDAMMLTAQLAIDPEEAMNADKT